MRVAINTLIVSPTGGGGTRTFITNLVRHISQVDRETTYHLLVSPINKHMFSGMADNFLVSTLPLRSNNRPLRGLFQQVLVPYYVRKHKVDVLLSPGNVATLFPGCKQVLIVDGAQALRETRRRYAPGSVSRARAAYFDLMLPLSLRRTSAVITVSQFMKGEIVQGGVPQDKVAVIYEGIDAAWFSSNGKEGGPDLPRPYILFLSDLHPYKNGNKLIRAFARLKAEWAVPHRLIIVGRSFGGCAEELGRLAAELGVGDSVLFTGPVAYESLAGVYGNADVFVHPSGFESFGLPVLEAMACGTPVISSDRTSLPEIIGDAGLTVDPDDLDALAHSIHRVVTDPTLREELIRKGLERARGFTWEDTAKETVKLFHQVYRN